MTDRPKLPVPEQCDACASFDIQFTGNEAIYGKPYGTWPYAYHCLACGAAVGCHPGTRIPLGRMADAKTRQLRAVAHNHFDPLWQSGAMTRSEAYKLLARHLSIPHQECHISQLNIEQLNFLIEACKGLTIDQANLEVLKRRKGKKDAKRNKRIERERSRERRFSGYDKKYSARRARSVKQDSEPDS